MSRPYGRLSLARKLPCVDKRAALGGTCLNIGCIPSKALLDSSELYEVASHRLAKHGIGVDKVSLDLATMLKRKDQIVKSLTDGIAFLFRKNKVTTIHGSGAVSAPKSRKSRGH